MSIETGIYKVLLKHGFKHHKCKHNKRLGILRSFTKDNGNKFVEIIQGCDNYYSLLFSGISKQYLPICVDIIDNNDLMYLDAFLRDNLQTN